jgi:hypothetical protein
MALKLFCAYFVTRLLLSSRSQQQQARPKSRAATAVPPSEIKAWLRSQKPRLHKQAANMLVEMAMAGNVPNNVSAPYYYVAVSFVNLAVFSLLLFLKKEIPSYH